MLKDIQKLLNDRRVLLVLFVLIIAPTLFHMMSPKIEDFSKLKRYMWMYNGTPKNSSYDIRGDNLAIPKEQEKVGIFYESSLERNHRNQRLYPAFAAMNDTLEIN